MSTLGIIFDHDGTLVDSEGIHFDIWQQLLAGYGLDFSRQEYLDDYCGVPTLQNAQLIINQYKLALSAEQLSTRKQEAITKRLLSAPFPLMPGAKEALIYCQNAGLAIGLASGAGRAELESTLNEHQLAQFFQAVTSKDDVKNSKPAPESYLTTLKKLKLPANHCVAIEDSNTGIRSAKSAGLYCIAVTYEFAKTQDLSIADEQVISVDQAAINALRYLTTSRP